MTTQEIEGRKRQFLSRLKRREFPCRFFDEKPRFTQQEIELAKIFAQDYPEGEIERADPNTLLFQESPEGTWNELPAKLFPSLGYAQTCKLSEIIEGDN